MPLFNFHQFCETADRASHLTVMRWTLSHVELGQILVDHLNDGKSIQSPPPRRYTLSQCKPAEVIAIKSLHNHTTTHVEADIKDRLKHMEKVLKDMEQTQAYAADTRVVTKRDLKNVADESLTAGVVVGVAIVTFTFIVPCMLCLGPVPPPPPPPTLPEPNTLGKVVLFLGGPLGLR